jgi:hypothetical protein
MAKNVALVGSAVAELRVKDILVASPEQVRNTFTHDEKSLYDEISRDYHKRFGEDLLWHHALGNRLHKALRAAERNEKKYGNHLMERMARALGDRDPQRLYMSVEIYRLYPDKGRFLKDIVNKSGPEGNHLTTTHLSHLVRIENAKQRDKLVDKVLTENLTTSETVNLVRDRRTPAETAPHGNNPAGRPIKKHKTLGQALAYMLVEFPKLSKRINDVWLGDPSLMSMAEELELVQATPELKLQVDKVKEEIENLRSALELLDRSCDVARTALDKKAVKYQQDLELDQEARTTEECPKGGKHQWVSGKKRGLDRDFCDRCKQDKPIKPVPPSTKRKSTKRLRTKDAPR